jgi:hypothetical protein
MHQDMQNNSRMYSAFVKFAQLLDDRLAQHIHTTEDSVRYTFFYSLMQEFELSPSDFELEYPHSINTKLEIDARVVKLNSIFELKYHNSPPKADHLPRTSKPGELFNDIFRLSSFDKSKATHCYLIYLTDSEMHRYFNNARNKFEEFYNLPLSTTIQINEQFLRQYQKTFWEKATKSVPVTSCLVQRQYHKELRENHWVTVWQIK